MKNKLQNILSQIIARFHIFHVFAQTNNDNHNDIQKKLNLQDIKLLKTRKNTQVHRLKQRNTDHSVPTAFDQ